MPETMTGDDIPAPGALNGPSGLSMLRNARRMPKPILPDYSPAGFLALWDIPGFFPVRLAVWPEPDCQSGLRPINFFSPSLGGR